MSPWDHEGLECWIILNHYFIVCQNPVVFLDTLSDINWLLLSNCNCLVMFVVCRLFSYYPNSMQALKALLIFALIYHSQQAYKEYNDEYGPGYGSCKTVQKCYDKDHPFLKLPDMTTPIKVCSVHQACRCLRKQCRFASYNNCEKDSVCIPFQC